MRGTIYERLKRWLLNNRMIAVAVVIVVAGTSVFTFVEKATEVTEILSNQVSMNVTVEQGPECGFTPKSYKVFHKQSVLDVGINNNSDKNVMITMVRLIPIRLTGWFWAGKLDVSEEYDVQVNDWYKMITIAQGYSPKNKAEREKLIQKRIAWEEEGLWWVKPDPIQVSAIPSVKYTIPAKTAERFRIRMGLSRAIDVVLGQINLEVVSDRGGTLKSGPHKIAVCTPENDKHQK